MPRVFEIIGWGDRLHTAERPDSKQHLLKSLDWLYIAERPDSSKYLLKSLKLDKTPMNLQPSKKRGCTNVHFNYYFVLCLTSRQKNLTQSSKRYRASAVKGLARSINDERYIYTHSDLFIHGGFIITDGCTHDANKLMSTRDVMRDVKMT